MVSQGKLWVNVLPYTSKWTLRTATHSHLHLRHLKGSSSIDVDCSTTSTIHKAPSCDRHRQEFPSLQPAVFNVGPNNCPGTKLM